VKIKINYLYLCSVFILKASAERAGTAHCDQQDKSGDERNVTHCTELSSSAFSSSIDASICWGTFRDVL
jgi:hypothetical protein